MSYNSAMAVDELQAGQTSSVATSAYDAFRQTRFFGSLDGLRALSILGVIWTHTWFGTPYWDRLSTIPILRSGRFGVEVFFTISGFLITTLLLRERDKYGTVSLKDFYIRRALRIWPLYYVVLGVYVLLVLLTERHTERGRVFFHYLPGYLTYTYTWFIGWGTSGAIFNFAWSLSTEEQFYCFWPFIVRVFRGAWPAAVMIALVVMRSVAQVGAVQAALPETSLPVRMLFSISVPICVGSLLALALHSPRGFGVLYRVLAFPLAPLVAVVALAFCIVPDDLNFLPLMIALPFLVGACVVREDHVLAGVLKWRPIALIGVLSYGMYLYNTLAVKAVRPLLGRVGVHHPLLAFPFILGATVLIAWLSYRYFESPFLALKARFSRLKPAPAAVAPVAIESAEIHAPVHP